LCQNDTSVDGYIQAAVHAAIGGEKDFPITGPDSVRQHNLVGGPDLCFSPGDYRITRTIELSPDVDGGGWGSPASPPNVRGIGKVNVRLNSTTLDIFSAILDEGDRPILVHIPESI
jgi:hypothetical protein